MREYVLDRIDEQLLDMVGLDFARMGISSQVKRSRGHDEPRQYLRRCLPTQNPKRHESRMFAASAHSDVQTNGRGNPIALVHEFAQFDARAMSEFFQLGRDVLHHGTNDVATYPPKSLVKCFGLRNIDFRAPKTSVDERQSMQIMFFHDDYGAKTRI